MEEANTFTLGGYDVFGRFPSGPDHVWYRGCRQQDQALVLLKRPQVGFRTAQAGARLRNEAEMACRLSLPGVLKTYGIEGPAHDPVLVLEDIGGSCLKHLAEARKIGLQEFLETAIVLADTLHGLHTQGVIHKDINPFHIIVNPKTGQVRLTGFGVASVLPREDLRIHHPDLIEGTLAYISPEQTGRINRPLDYRTDFYSLGVTLYEVLTGERPFPVTAPADIIHAHIAMNPVPPHMAHPAIPAVVSLIVTKLLEKNADNRYQSGLGLKADLSACLERLKGTGAIEDFPLGLNDRAEKLMIPQGLYGRDSEKEMLFDAFDAVCRGQKALLTVSGYAGIGKTSLVDELAEPVFRKRGFYIKGKFDRAKRHMPYNGLISALHDLVLTLVAEPGQRFDQFKRGLQSALASDGRMLADLIPEVEYIVGPQPPLPKLSPLASKKRWNQLIQRFFNVFCSFETPMVLFLDDLQWIDLPTVQLIELIMTDPEIQSLLIIGAFRDNEMAATHPFNQTLTALDTGRITIHRQILAPLTAGNVTHWMADCLNLAPADVQGLAELITQKTGGNPFFVKQFLTTLYLEQQLSYDSRKNQWQWSLPEITAMDITENIVELLLNRLKRLPVNSRTIISTAAAIGHRFDIATIAAATGLDPHSIRRHLLEITRDGLITALFESQAQPSDPPPAQPSGHAFKFVHDRVRQAAYALLDPEGKKRLHLTIGRILLDRFGPDFPDNSVFDVLGHLNLVDDRITSDGEREQWIRLNLVAGRKARASTAFETAHTYFTTALKISRPHQWRKNYDLALELLDESIEAAYLSANFQVIDKLADIVVQNARRPIDTVNAFHFRIIGYMAKNKLAEAKAAGLEILTRLGTCLQNDRKHINRDLNRMAAHFIVPAGKDRMQALPEIQDAGVLATVRILADMTTPCYFIDADMHSAIVREAVDITLHHGVCAISPFFFSLYASILCGALDKVDTGYLIGKYGLRLFEKQSSHDLRPRSIHIFNMHVRHFKEHLRNSLAPLLEAYQGALENRDLQHAAYSINAYCFHAYLLGKNLAWVAEEMASSNQTIRDLNQDTSLNLLEINQQAVMNLVQAPTAPTTLAGPVYDERKRLPKHRRANDGNALFYFHFNKLLLNYLFHQYARAVRHADQAKEHLNAALSLASVPVFYCFDSLAHIARCTHNAGSDKAMVLQRVAGNQKKLKNWADHAPANFMHKYHLVEAERLRLSGGRLIDIVDHYEKAINLALEHEYMQDAALAHELSAGFWMDSKVDAYARLHIRRALDHYRLWGAQAKVQHLEKTHHSLLQSFKAYTPTDAAIQRAGAPGSPPFGITESVDLDTLIKASQAIVSGLAPESLYATFLTILVRNVGAQKGMLIRSEDADYLVDAALVTRTDGTLGKSDEAVESVGNKRIDEAFPLAVIAYVDRTGRPLVIDDARLEEQFLNDPYVQHFRPRSILCTPIVHKSQSMGILYFENNLVTHAFNPNRLEITQLLSSQMAIAFENARLYFELKKAEEKYRGLYENAVEGIFQATMDGRFISVNPSMARIFGYDSPEEMIAQVVSIERQLYVHPENRRRYLALMLEQKTIAGMDEAFYRKDNSTFWASLHMRPIFSRTNKLIYIQGMIIDNTARKRAMEALVESEGSLRKENIRLRSEIKDRYRFGDLIGKSDVMQAIYDVIVSAAATDVNVIVFGETGTGKELVARAIHSMSRRRDKAFVPVNCGAIPMTLLESEFFGYKKGAFTGAATDKAGYLDLADGGVLFLDELGELSMDMQVKLLRAIDGAGYLPVGSNKEKKSDFRIISATNADLQESLKHKTLREDFFYRIHIVPINLPPLRHRKEDIPLLIEHFVKQHGYDPQLIPIDSETMQALLSYDWPGNVRELQNTLHRFAALGRLDFVNPTQVGRDGKAPMAFAVRPAPGQAAGLGDAVAEFEKQFLYQILDAHGWRRDQAAARLGISRMSLYNKMKKYGLSGR